MYCTGCGIQSSANDLFCGGCGNVQRNTSGTHAELGSTPVIFHVGQSIGQPAVPESVKGWSWGAFLLNWIWAVGNNTWIGLLAMVPYVNVPVAIWLGFKGREMAWRNRRWDSIEHFNRVQRTWSQWAVAIVCAFSAIIVLYSLNTPRTDAAQDTEEASDAMVQQQEDAAPRRTASSHHITR